MNDAHLSRISTARAVEPARRRGLSVFLKLFAVLSSLAGGAPFALADAPVEVFYLQRAEISDEVLREALGVASFSWRALEDQKLPGLVVYARRGDRYEPERTAAVSETLPVSGWDFSGSGVRRYPVVERDGEFVRVAIDAAKGTYAWLRLRNQESGSVPQEHSLSFQSFEEPFPAGMELEALHLASEPPRLCSGPSDSSSCLPLVLPGQSSPEMITSLGGRSEEGFLLVGRRDYPELERARPIGWIRFRDRTGRLVVWARFAPGC